MKIPRAAPESDAYIRKRDFPAVPEAGAEAAKSCVWELCLFTELSAQDVFVLSAGLVIAKLTDPFFSVL